MIYGIMVPGGFTALAVGESEAKHTIFTYIHCVVFMAGNDATVTCRPVNSWSSSHTAGVVPVNTGS